MDDKGKPYNRVASFLLLLSNVLVVGLMTILLLNCGIKVFECDIDILRIITIIGFAKTKTITSSMSNRNA